MESLLFFSLLFFLLFFLSCSVRSLLFFPRSRQIFFCECVSTCLLKLFLLILFSFERKIKRKNFFLLRRLCCVIVVGAMGMANGQMAMLLSVSDLINARLRSSMQ